MAISREGSVYRKVLICAFVHGQLEKQGTGNGNGNGDGKRERETETGRGSRRLKGAHIVGIRL